MIMNFTFSGIIAAGLLLSAITFFPTNADAQQCTFARKCMQLGARGTGQTSQDAVIDANRNMQNQKSQLKDRVEKICKKELQFTSKRMMKRKHQNGFVVTLFQDYCVL